MVAYFDLLLQIIVLWVLHSQWYSFSLELPEVGIARIGAARYGSRTTSLIMCRKRERLSRVFEQWWTKPIAHLLYRPGYTLLPNLHTGNQGMAKYLQWRVQKPQPWSRDTWTPLWLCSSGIKVIWNFSALDFSKTWHPHDNVVAEVRVAFGL